MPDSAGLRTADLDWGDGDREGSASAGEAREDPTSAGKARGGPTSAGEARDGRATADGDGDPEDGDAVDPDRLVTHRPGDGAFADLLDLLDDEYARGILSALTDAPRPARELMDACGGSRATVYRRLDRLEAHDLVRAETELHAGGHHRKVFEASVDRVTVDLVGESPELRLVFEADSDRPDAATRPA